MEERETAQALLKDKYIPVPLEEVERRYDEVQRRFKEVKSHYSGFFGYLRRNLREEDLKTLTGLVGDVLPLSMQPVVQRGESQKVSIDAVVDLQDDILHFLSGFRNSGIQRIA